MKVLRDVIVASAVIFLALAIWASVAAAELAPARASQFEQQIAKTYGTKCPHITYHMHADAELMRAYPEATTALTDQKPLIIGMATGDSLPAWNNEPCTVWFKAHLSWSKDRPLHRYLLVHELLHTAGFAHGPAMVAAEYRLLHRPSRLNRHADRGSIRPCKFC